MDSGEHEVLATRKVETKSAIGASVNLVKGSCDSVRSAWIK